MYNCHHCEVTLLNQDIKSMVTSLSGISYKVLDNGDVDWNNPSFDGIYYSIGIGYFCSEEHKKYYASNCTRS